MNCVIVDDDTFSTRLIADFIKRTSAVNLVNSFSNAIDAVDYLSITTENIDIIFLDIEMPEMSGMDFMKSVNIRNTQVIIYSSQEKYALESYEYNVCDYLLKPVNYARFLKAINKAKFNLQQLQNEAFVEDETTEDGEEKEDEDVTIKDNLSAVYKIRPTDVIYIEALENYVALVTTTRRLMIHTSMKNFLEKFPEKYVVRVHRSFAIGKRYVKDIINNEITLLLADKKIPIGKSYRDDIMPNLSEGKKD